VVSKANDINALIAKLPASRQRQLREVVAELAARRMEALNLWTPMEQQAAFHECRTLYAIVMGGNRSGKSAAVYAEVARAALGRDPHDKYRKPDATGRFAVPFVIWIVCHKEAMIGRTVHRYLFERGAFQIIRDLDTGKYRTYRPNDPADAARAKEAKAAPPLIPERYIKELKYKDKGGRVFTRCELRNGAVIYAFSSNADPDTGDPVDLAVIDEDTKPEWVTELQSRLSDRSGSRLIWAARPQLKNNAMLDLVHRGEAEATKPQHERRVTVFRLNLLDNQYIPPETKADRLADWTPEQQRSRIYGDTGLDSVLNYPQFSRDANRYPSPKVNYNSLESWLVDGKVPADCCRFVSIDPGPYACWAALFFAVPPPEACDHWVVYDEIYLTNSIICEFTEAMRRKSEGVTYRGFIMDDHGSRVRSANSHIPIRQQISAAFRSARIESELTGCGFILGCDNIPKRSGDVRNALTLRPDGTPKLVILQGAAPNLQMEIERYRRAERNGLIVDEPAPNQRNHAINALEYLCAYAPQYSKPAFKTPEDLAYQHYLDRKRELAGENGDTIYFGAGPAPSHSFASVR
jgi:hypothetical protein